MNSSGEEFLAKRNLPGQRVGAKACFDFFAEYLTEALRSSTTSSALIVRAYEEMIRVSF